MDSYKDKNLEELLAEKKALEEKYKNIEDECISKSLPYADFCEKAHDVKEKMYYIDKYIRLKRLAEVTYGKEWNGDMYSMEKFINMVNRGILREGNGVGYYATELSKSDIQVHPSDITSNIYRNDFTHVIWFEYDKD